MGSFIIIDRISNNTVGAGMIVDKVQENSKQNISEHSEFEVELNALIRSIGIIMKKENAAKRVERIKKEKSGLDVLEDIKRYAKSNEPLDPEDIDRFKWYGLYTQNKNSQDESDENLYFMLRVKLEKGAMNLEQMKVVSQISEKYARLFSYDQWN